MLNDEYPLNTADKMAIGNEEGSDKTIIGEDTEGIEICISQTDGKGVSTQTWETMFYWTKMSLDNYIYLKLY